MSAPEETPENFPHALVVALIEADKEYDAAWAAYGLAETESVRSHAWSRVQGAIANRQAALARMEGVQ